MKKTSLLVGVLCLMGAVVAAAQEADPEKITENVAETVDVEKRTQANLDDWSEERQALDVRYRTARANVEFLTERIARREERAAALDAKVAELERRKVESLRLNEVIQDTLDAVLGRLTKVVERDLPFLEEERSARLVNLRNVMASPDLDPAEKLRFLLEALLIEAQYGETVEVVPSTIAVDGRDMHADVLRIGRLAMFWRSPDGSRIGTWDPAARAWIELPGRFNRTISRSMEMASRMRPIELISLPLGRINR